MKAGQNIMKIQLGKVAYDFPNIKTLEAFINLHSEDIVDPEEMTDIYGKFDRIGFHFYKTAHGFDWSFDYIETYKRWEYRIIKCGQRTE